MIHVDIYKSFGDYIRLSRIQSGLSQEELAKKLGISQPYYSRIEAGMRAVDLKLACKMCDVLHLDFGEFLKNHKKMCEH